MLVSNVPAIGVLAELEHYLSDLFPHQIEEFQVLDSKESAAFTEIVRLQFPSVQVAKAAKQQLRSAQAFYGHLLEMEYATEYDTVQDIKQKIEDRKAYVHDMLRTKSTKGAAESQSASATARKIKAKLARKPNS